MMSFKKLMSCAVALVAFWGMGMRHALAEEASTHSSESREDKREGFLAINGDAGYYTYGMGDVNDRFRNGGNSAINGGMGYGAALRLGIMNQIDFKLGMDYLFASRNASRTVNGVKYNTQVSLPATMLFIGGELVVLRLPVMNLKLLAGYTLVSIYNGDERSTDNSLDFGTVTGSGSGGQFGAGLEIFLARGFSLEADLAYNMADITGATFAGAPADPNSTSSTGAVDYSGLVAKVAFNIYLFR